MKYTIVIAALLGLIQAEEIYEAPVANATAKSFADKKADAKAESDEDDDDDDSSSDIQGDDSSSSGSAVQDGDSSASGSDVQDSDSSSGSAVQDGDSSASGSDVQDSDSSSGSAVQDGDSSASGSDVQDSDSSASGSDVQLEGDDESSDHSGEFFEAREHGTGPLDKKYERVVPAHFAESSDDLFMRSMIKTYALEGKNKDGSPNGQFFMDEATTRAAAGEVLETHKGLKGGAKADYLKTYFPRTWAHFDVNKTGKVGVEVMPQFMRFLASDQTLSL
jgi:hypothetical protein